MFFNMFANNLIEILGLVKVIFYENATQVSCFSLVKSGRGLWLPATFFGLPGRGDTRGGRRPRFAPIAARVPSREVLFYTGHFFVQPPRLKRIA